MSKLMITALPLGEADRVAFIACANATFETVLTRMEPADVETIRKLWSAEHYVGTLLKADMLPIERGYALNLVGAFLVHHVVDLTDQADQLAGAAIH